MSSNERASNERPPPGASLRSRLTRGLLLGCGLLFLLTGLVLDRAVVRWMRADFDRSLLSQAQALVALTEQESGRVEFDFVADLMPAFGEAEDDEDEAEEDAAEDSEDEDLEDDGEEDAEDDPLYFELWLDGTEAGTEAGALGEVFARSPSLGDGHLSRHGDLSRRVRYDDADLPVGEPGRQVQADFVPQIEVPDDVEAELGIEDANLPGITGLDPTADSPDYRVATLVVARSTESLAERIAYFRWSLAGGGLLLMLAMAGIVHVAVGSGLKPLREVTRQVGALDGDHLDQRLDAVPPAELAPLVDKLNLLLERLQAAFERERRFSSDVAHELRTPIAELRSLAEVGGRWPDDRIAVRQFFGDTRQIAAQMEQVVSQLLAVARTEAGIETVDVERLHVAGLVDETLHLHEGSAREAGAELRSRVPDPVWLDSDADKLQLILHNLLSNAVSYTPEGGTVDIDAAFDGDSMELTVSNPCDNLTDDDLPHLFDRFWRKDQARSTPGSSGLGLSLVRSLAELLGAELTTRLEEVEGGDGRRFSISLRFPPGAAGEMAQRVAS